MTLLYDSSAIYDTTAYTYDGFRLGGGLGFEALLVPRPTLRLSDRPKIDGPEPHGTMSGGWNRKGRGLA